MISHAHNYSEVVYTGAQTQINGHNCDINWGNAGKRHQSNPHKKHAHRHVNISLVTVLKPAHRHVNISLVTVLKHAHQHVNISLSNMRGVCISRQTFVCVDISKSLRTNFYFWVNEAFASVPELIRITCCHGSVLNEALSWRVSRTQGGEIKVSLLSQSWGNQALKGLYVPFI